MKKKTISTKLSLKKITIVALDAEKEGRVLGGGDSILELCIFTEDCATVRLCNPASGIMYKRTVCCPASNACPPASNNCPTVLGANCSVAICPVSANC
ncbi:class I lanthipeptide [Taibaiella koreensis]|uniref:class I lanthipeptide n=1 Tax=Taibaiella koreensis TaxID=1268548 RepID=UPI0013C330B4|nr:class I lanthipeptide [Taibaiella koreensis]